MRFSASEGMLVCEHCGCRNAIQTPEGWAAEDQEHALSDDAVSRRKWQGKHSVACDSCGGSWVLDATQAATECPYCGRAHVAEQDADMIQPDAVLPFAITHKDAESRFGQWLRKRYFAPGSLRREAFTKRWRGIYYPYWTYDASTHTNYQANAGTYYYVQETRTRTVDGKQETYTESVRHTRWNRVSGSVSRDFDDVLVRAALLTEKAAAPEDFQLKDLKPYRPEYLSGLMARRYEIGVKEGFSRAREIIDRQIHTDIVDDVAADEVNVLHTDTDVTGVTFKHVLLPLWGNHYLYRGKEYDVWVNGQTGKVSGKAPLSFWKVALCVGAGLAVLGGILYLVNVYHGA